MAHRSTSTGGPESGFWVPMGERVTVAGLEMAGGLLYVGRGLKSLSGYDTEPSLIDPSLKVDRKRPDYLGQELSYWPSYSRISPASRAAYLEWLAEGRKRPNTGVGYVFLYFYGLERRLLGGIARRDMDPADRAAIIDEVRRLLGLYGHNNSFNGYASRLLEVAECLGDLSGLMESLPPETVSFEMPFKLKVGLGLAGRDQRPLPASWAYAWLRFGTQYWPRTPATRCREEFELLFDVRYRQHFNGGVIPKRSKKVLKAAFAPASQTFGGSVKLMVEDLPDVTGQTAVLGPMRELADRCTDELDAYSRWLGKHPDSTPTPGAIALLPLELADPDSLGTLGLLLQRLELETADGPSLVSAHEIWQAWNPGSAKASKGEFVQIAQALERRGLAIEPDPRFGWSPNLETSLMVFRALPGAPATPSPEYQAAALFLDVGMALSAADGSAGDEESRLLREYLDAVGVTFAELERLRVRLKWLEAKPPSLQSFKKRVEGLTSTQKATLCQLLLAIVAADGVIDPGEVKLLTKFYPMLGREPSQVYSDLHSWDSSAPTDDEPIEIVEANVQRGVPLPPRQPGAVRLDMDKVRAKIRETELVGAILGDVFQPDEPQAEASTDEPAVQVVAGLDRQHGSLAMSLVGRATISRDEFAQLAKVAGLLPDGALETLNEWNFERAGVPLLDGDDELEIEMTMLKEVLA